MMTVTPLANEHPRGVVVMHGNIIGVLGIARDLTERKSAENRIAYLNRVHAMLSGINTLIVRVRERDELFRETCRIACDAGGFRTSWIGLVDRRTMNIALVASAGNDEELLAATRNRRSALGGTTSALVARAISEKEAVVANDSARDPMLIFGAQGADAGIRSLAVLPLMVADEAVGVLVLYAGERHFFHAEELKLVTELARDVAFAIDNLDKQKRLDYLAYYDALTGLANRSLFLERVAQYIRSAAGSGRQLAIALIDLERFKNLNDSLGQPEGDALLRQVAAWLTRTTGDAKLLARVDADHFALVLPEVNPGGSIAHLIEKVMAAFVEHPFRLDDAIFRIAFKSGVALFPDDGADADALFRNAETALKTAKTAGDRYRFFTPHMTAAAASQLTMEIQLRQALDKDEFVLHYQPKISLASGKLTGAEALIRWNDPRMGLVPPGRFISILEKTGLIYEVGRWALCQAVEDYRRWRSAGLAAVRIAVNVSPLQLRNRGFIVE